MGAAVGILVADDIIISLGLFSVMEPLGPILVALPWLIAQDELSPR
jgi:hypothetical protein